MLQKAQLNHAASVARKIRIGSVKKVCRLDTQGPQYSSIKEYALNCRDPEDDFKYVPKLSHIGRCGQLDKFASDRRKPTWLLFSWRTICTRGNWLQRLTMLSVLPAGILDVPQGLGKQGRALAS